MSHSTEVILKTLDPRTIGPNRVLAFIGRRGAGKTFLMDDIVYYYKNIIPEAIIWSSTEEGNESWGNRFPELYIHTHYDSQTLAAVYDRQKARARRRKREARLGVPHERRTSVRPILLIIEDQSYKKSVFRCSVLADVLMNGRHYGMTVMITTQYSRSIPVEIRAQFDYVFCCLEKFVQNRKRLYEDYFGVFPSFDSFNQVMMQCTENFGCLVMNNMTRSCKVSESVFYYKGRDHGDYKFGSRAYWLFHFMHYRDRSEEEEDELHRVDALARVRPGSRVTVQTRVER